MTGEAETTTLEVRVRRGHPDFLDLPWSVRLEHWTEDNTGGRLVRMAHGLSRHVVRFIREGDRVYALKSTEPALAHREYDLLRALADEGLPVVEAVGVVTGRRGSDGEVLGAVLVTRYLDYALPFRYLFGTTDVPELRGKLIDAGIVLLTRLHLEGFFWGDCSLNNVLFRRDAGAFMAYLVDAETGEKRPSLSDGMREHDLDIARTNIAGDLSDLVASGRLEEDSDVWGVVEEFNARYHSLWDELTRVEAFQQGDRHGIDARIRRLEDLGFDVPEVSLSTTQDGHVLMRPTLLEEGHHCRELQRLTGLAVQENQARRFLADIASYQAWLMGQEGRSIPYAVAAARWITEVYEPRVARIPSAFRDRLEPAEFFHEVLDHRFYMSERAGRSIDTDTALDDYVDTVLAVRPPEKVVTDVDTDV